MTDTSKKQIFRPKRLSPQEIREGCVTLVGENEIETKVCIAQEELRQGMDIIEEYKESVTCYGSARIPEGSDYYEKARSLTNRIVKETGYAVITGGGPGIMEAANRGANEAGGKSLGLTIVLPHEQHTNPYVNLEIPFYYFFTRKTSLSFSSKVMIGFPGGFGTFDEIFEVVTLMQTGKMLKRPVVLFGADFWQPFLNVIQTIMVEKFKTIGINDMDYFTVTDNEDLVLQIIQESKNNSELLAPNLQ